MHAHKWRSTSTLKLMVRANRITKECTVVALLPFVARGSTPLEVPLICLIRALEHVVLRDGPRDVPTVVSIFFPEMNNDDEVDLREFVARALHDEPHASWSGEDNVDWLESNGSSERTAAKRKKYIEHILRSEVLPHIQRPEDRLAYLGVLVRRLVAVEIGLLAADDRDHNGGKRLDGPVRSRARVGGGGGWLVWFGPASSYTYPAPYPWGRGRCWLFCSGSCSGTT